MDPNNSNSKEDSYTDEQTGTQWKLHSCPKTLYPTLKEIFPDLGSIIPKKSELSNPESGKQDFSLSVIVYWQKTSQDMSGYSDDVQKERDEKTQHFIDWANALCSKIKNLPCSFVDFVDPSSGLPFLCRRGATVFVETDDAIFNLGYQILDFGCCKAVSHPKWGTHSFLSIVITDASPADVLEILRNNPH